MSDTEVTETITVDEREPPQAPDGWHIETEDDAAFAVDRILSARERLDRVTAQTAVVVEKAEREVRRAEEFFAPQLAAWFAANPPRKGRTLSLPTGDISFRRVSGRVVVKDAAKALAWARESLPSAVRVRTTTSETIIVDEVARHLRTLPEDALPPPGIDVEGDADRFYVSAPKGKK